jgi:hypothetical protein
MIETWLDEAQSGWPYAATWTFALVIWLLLAPPLFLINVVWHGLRDLGFCRRIVREEWRLLMERSPWRLAAAKPRALPAQAPQR